MECFGVVAEAEAGINTLRRLIIHLGSTGHLGTQGDDDEPAEELLQKISQERTEALSAKEVNSLPDWSPPSESLPKKWCWVRLGDLLVFGPRNGWSPRPVDHETRTCSLALSATTSGKFDASHIKFVDVEVDQSSHLWLRTGDILVQRANTIENVGVAAIYDGEPTKFIYPDLMMKIRAASSVVPAFLHIAMSEKGARDFLRMRASGTSGSMPKINQAALSSLPLRLPPLAEQHRIVAKVDQLMAMLDDLEQRQEKKRTAAIHVSKASLDSLVNAENPDQLARAWGRVSESFGLVAIGDATGALSQFRHILIRLGLSGRLTRRYRSDGRVSDLLSTVVKTRRLRGQTNKKRVPAREEAVSSTDPDGLPSIPEEWCWTSLECLAEHIVDGTHHTPTYVEEGVCFISATNVKNRRIIFDGCRRITEAQYQELMRRCAPKRGDVLITKSGTLGEVAVVNDDRRFTLFESVALVPVIPPISPEYIAHCAEVACAGEFGKATERGVAVKHLHLRDLRRMPIPLPPVEEQQRIVAVLGRLMALVDCLGERIAAKDSCSRRLAEVGLQLI